MDMCYIQLFKVTDNAVIIVPNLSSKVKPVQYLSSTISAFDNFNSDCRRLVRECIRYILRAIRQTSRSKSALIRKSGFEPRFTFAIFET